MSSSYDAIVIGSGIGGICCAALLSHAGYKTLVLERLNVLGGRASSYRKDGCIVDRFIHTLGNCDKGPVTEILKQVGKLDALKFWRIEPDNKPVLWAAGKQYIYPDPSFATDEEIWAAYKGMGLSNNDCSDMIALDKQIYLMSDQESHDLDDVPYMQWLSQRSDNPLVHAMHMSRCLMAGGMGLDEASTGEMIRMTQSWHLHSKIGYPHGGFGAIAETMAGVVTECGGEVRLRETVDAILVKNGAAAGVRLKSGEEIGARAVVSNAGIKSTIEKLVPRGAVPDAYRTHVSDLKYGKFNDVWIPNQLTLHMLLDEPVTKHTLVFSVPVEGSRSAEGLDAISFKTASEDEKKRILGQTDIYMTFTSNMDPSIVPHGKQLLNVNATSFKGLSEEETVEGWKNILDLLYPGLKKRVLWTDVVPGSAMKEFSGHPVPNVIGLSQMVGQVGKNRPSAECPLAGLFLTGADVGKQRVGVELAADGALIAAKAVQRFLRT
jgi:all-trans-retinol 13,14-reductase